jgi:hypothetical protein
MDILSYLSELIQTRKAVGISGLGTVFKKKLPGRYDAETHSFLPPSYTLDFSTELKEESLLADFICKHRNVSLETANYFINEFSEALQVKLNEQHQAPLGDLGQLIKENEEITFVPANTVNYGFDFYGLPTVKAAEELTVDQPSAVTVPEQEPVAEELVPETPAVEEPEQVAPQEEVTIPEVEETQLLEPEAKPTLQSVVEDNERVEENPGDDQLAPQANAEVPKNEQQLREEIEALNFYRSKSPYLKGSVPEQEEAVRSINDSYKESYPVVNAAEPEPIDVFMPEEEIRSTSVIIKILMVIVVLLIALTVAYFLKPDWFSAITGNSSIVVPKTTAIQKTTPAVIADSTVINDTTVVSGLAADTSQTATAATSLAPKDSVITYEVIGASMHDQKEADNFIALMKRSGITAKVVTNMAGKRLKMSIATLKDEASAKQEAARLTEKLKIPGIYIYRNKQQ